MALLFSAVRATANDQEVEFFVGGIPREYDDLEGWTAFDRFMSTDPNSKIRANASVTIGNHFAIHGLKVYDGGDKGLQVLYPGHKGTDNKFYDDFHPITKEAREALNGYVLDAYEQKLEQTQGEDQAAGEDLDEDEEPAFEQTM